MIDHFWEETGVIEIEGAEKLADFSADYWEKWFFEVTELFGVRYTDRAREELKNSDSYFVPFTCTVEYELLVSGDTKLSELTKNEALFLVDHSLREYIEKFFD